MPESGKEATLGILSEGDFFGEGGLGGQFTRTSSATAITDCVLLHVERKALMNAMSIQPKLSALFMRHLVSGTSGTKTTWSINFSTPAKSDWHECFC